MLQAQQQTAQGKNLVCALYLINVIKLKQIISLI